ncbi:UDP-N-acetylglucosamine 4,6-dehydratase [Geomonas limicola]|uniref:UDP-N-acetylglucosamine 4,6-dehydratase n=1 Tax=Geomonas limicola TaxID=2740186 RepID=A0A6V8N9W0_9BACT|nr:UDP-N-acetylglucosamine 4,6-dehydratase [Geomonas limicola]GFO69230.1 UDP-N-acetylglucosamine 4,6-dehydratase [Geomonas limicola]
MDILDLIGRREELFVQDIASHEAELTSLVQQSSFLILGGAGSIGQEVVKQIFRRSPQRLHVVDISENNMVELVRDVRSSLGYIPGDFQTLALDSGSPEFEAFLATQNSYDYVLNLSALKHVRSEKDPFTLMRLVNVNIFNTDTSLQQAIRMGAKKYFCVSTDKAANPVNMMGASKRIMEMFLMRRSLEIPVSTARFANVAFSDGSLLHGFNQRIMKRQPLSAPQDVKRYFVTPEESGELCLLSCLLGENRDIFFPKLSERLHLITFAEIAVKYLEQRGYTPFLCSTEDEARERVTELSVQGKWPCYFFDSDTTGEKDFEEFFMADEHLDLQRFQSIGIVKNEALFDPALLDLFVEKIALLKKRGMWTKEEMVQLFTVMIPEFGHKETGKYLDGRM